MLYVTVVENGVESTQELHSDEPFQGTPRNVVRVQADGDELYRIKAAMEGIPIAHSNRVVEWYGDHAKFIAANWR